MVEGVVCGLGASRDGGEVCDPCSLDDSVKLGGVFWMVNQVLGFDRD